MAKKVDPIEDVVVTVHLDVDPNDPRNVTPAGPLPSLNDPVEA